jgi:CRP/FNR family transcriptional regulator, cyclic AMP receptor protein
MAEKKSILLIDDEEELTSLLKEQLEKQDYRVITASDGQLGLRKYKNEKFDLIITDLYMPKLNGIDLINSLKDMDEKKQLPCPVIVISGQLEKFKANLIILENVSFLEKPFDNVELLGIVDKLINPGKAAINELKRKLLPGEILLKQGEVGNSMFWILSGKFKVTQIVNGKEIVLNTLRSSELVGEMSLIDDKPRSATVTATEESEVLEIPHQKFAKVLTQQPLWFKSLIKNLSLRLRITNQKIHLDD